MLRLLLWVLNLIVWMAKFILMSIQQLLQLPLVFLKPTTIEEKRQAVKMSLLCATILTGAFLMFSEYPIVGVILILGPMLIGAFLIREDGSI